MKTKLLRTFIPLLLVAAFMVQMGCGPQDEQAATNRVGPAGPTSQNKLYFDLAVTPHTVQSGSNVDVTYRVWDSSGNMASGVMAVIAGIEVEPTKAITTTGEDGIGGWIIAVGAAPGSVVPITVVIENLALTAPIQIMSSSSTEARVNN